MAMTRAQMAAWRAARALSIDGTPVTIRRVTVRDSDDSEPLRNPPDIRGDLTIAADADRLDEACSLIAEINLGGTAIGTGLNAHPQYAALVCERLRALTGLPLVTAGDLVEATSDVGAFVQLSGVTKRTAVKLSKICNDLRLLSSGPRAAAAGPTGMSR